MPETLEEAPATRPAPAGDRASFRVAIFVAVLVVVLFAGYGVGRLTGGGVAAGPAAGGESRPDSGASGGGHAEPGGHAMPGMPFDESQAHQHDQAGNPVVPGGPAAGMSAATTVAGMDAPGGLSLSSAGLTLTPAATTFPAGAAQRLSFRITGPGGAPITTYAVVHDKPLHLVVVRRDLSGYQHLHPTMAIDGTWSLPLRLGAPGSYRAIADFTAIVGGRRVATTLGTDLTVAGSYRPARLPAPVQRVSAGGFQVGYEGTPRAGETVPILVNVTAPGGEAAALEPYLGAFGHLVVLRDGDVGYAHVHPEPRLTDGKVKFWLAVPGPGTYRMFFDFQVAGRVHTAAWTVSAA